MIEKYIKRYIRQYDGSLKLDWIPHFDVDYGESQTDKSNYRPNVPLYSQIEANKAMPSNLVYDFPDGKDTGLNLTPLRDKSLDITEVQQIKNALQKSVDKQEKAIKDEMNRVLDDQKNSKNDSSVSSDTSSSSSE